MSDTVISLTFTLGTSTKVMSVQRPIEDASVAQCNNLVTTYGALMGESTELKKAQYVKTVRTDIYPES